MLTAGEINAPSACSCSLPRRLTAHCPRGSRRGTGVGQWGGGALNQTVTAPVFAQASGGLHDGNFDIEAQSYANLATGGMGLKVAATPYVPVLGGAVGYAQSWLWDMLTVSGPANALVPVTFTLQFDALLYFGSLQSSQGGRLHLTAYFGFGGVNEDVVEIEGALSKDETGSVSTDTIDCWGNCSSSNQPLTTAGVVDTTPQFTALLSQGVSHSFQAYVIGSVYTGIDAVGVFDALNTARVGVSLPAGYSLSSASGVFLTSAVPEPAPWMLMLLGSAAWLRRRRAASWPRPSQRAHQRSLQRCRGIVASVPADCRRESFCHQEPAMSDTTYHTGMRALQDRFDSRRLADRLDEKLGRSAFTEQDRAFIESRSMFFLATADEMGRPDCSYKGGNPGFVRITGAGELEFPSYDGNGQFRSLGNVQANAAVGLLFIDFESPRRLRVNGLASLLDDEASLARHHGAQLVVRVAVRRIFPNCPRYIHKSVRPSDSANAAEPGSAGFHPDVPRPGYEPPVAGWKSMAIVADVLPPPAKRGGSAA